jgi:sporulation protein YlmC with PRC-barrel domain
MKETTDKIVVFGHRDSRFDIPKSRIMAVGRNIILDMDFPEIFEHKVDRNVPYPQGNQ